MLITDPHIALIRESSKARELSTKALLTTSERVDLKQGEGT